MSKKLRDVEREGGVTNKWYTHDDTKITVETSQDVEPVFKSTKAQAEWQSPKADFRFKCEIPNTVLVDECKKEAQRCGLSTSEMLAEVMKGRTDRAKKIWRKLSEDREFNKFHAKTYQ